MSTVAAMPGVMAADGFEVDTDTNTIIAFKAQKIYRLNDGRLVGAVGNSYDIEKFIEWMNNPENPKPKVKELNAVVMELDEKLFLWDKNFIPIPAEYPYAVGAGLDFALAILDDGGSVEKAIAAAIKRNAFTGGQITVVKL